jgi:acetyl esterase/lipase
MMGTMFPLASDAKRDTVDAGGVPAEWISVADSTDKMTILYLHGGGHVIGSTTSHADLVARLSRATGARALSLNYRLAPEHPFPAALEDAQAAYLWLLDNGARPETIVVSGDSAGGNLALALMLALKDAGEPLPRGAALISPGTDFARKGGSYEDRVEADPILSPALVDVWARLYLGDADPESPLVSPLRGDLGGLPPILIIVGDAEILLDDAVRFAEKATEAGVDCTIEVWEEMVHIFPIFAPILPEGQQAIDRIGEWVKEHISARVSA